MKQIQFALPNNAHSCVMFVYISCTFDGACSDCLSVDKNYSSAHHTRTFKLKLFSLLVSSLHSFLLTSFSLLSLSLTLPQRFNPPLFIPLIHYDDESSCIVRDCLPCGNVFGLHIGKSRGPLIRNAQDLEHLLGLRNLQFLRLYGWKLRALYLARVLDSNTDKLEYLELTGQTVKPLTGSEVKTRPNEGGPSFIV